MEIIVGGAALVAAVAAIVLWVRRSIPAEQEIPEQPEPEPKGAVFVDVRNRKTGETTRIYPFPGYMMEYVDANGELTRRPIFIIHADRRGRFEAYCFLRKDMRSFVENAVISLTRIRGNEPVTNIVAEIRKYRAE